MIQIYSNKRKKYKNIYKTLKIDNIQKIKQIFVLIKCS